MCCAFPRTAASRLPLHPMSPAVSISCFCGRVLKLYSCMSIPHWKEPCLFHDVYPVLTIHVRAKCLRYEANFPRHM